MTNKPQFQVEFAWFAGQLANSIGFNQSLGQIFGYLYCCQTAESLSDIAKVLGISKGNVSINIRILESWGAVFPVGVKGSRRDHYYQANTNLKEVALRRLEEGLGKRLSMADQRLKDLANLLESDSGASAPQLKKVKDLQTMVSRTKKGLALLPKLITLAGL